MCAIHSGDTGGGRCGIIGQMQNNDHTETTDESNSLSRRITPACPKGEVIFDQHYSASLYELATPTERYKTRFPVASSVPKKDVLLSLLLSGRAVTIRPYWMTQEAASLATDLLRREGLARLLPESTYDNAAAAIIHVVENSTDLGVMNSSVETGYYDTVGGLISFSPDREREHMISEAQHSVNMINAAHEYFAPVIRASAGHLGFGDLSFADISGISEIVGTDDSGLTSLTISRDLEYFFMDSVGILEEGMSGNRAMILAEQFASHLSPNESFDEGQFCQLFENIRKLRAALLASICSSACVKYAAATGCSLRTNATARSNEAQFQQGNDGYYQLHKIQFQDLRYPVIENIDDVLRLRDSRHLAPYRAVLEEYSSRLRVELESERIKVLDEFKRDLKKAHTDLEKLGRRMEHFKAFAFWVSIPLTVLGIILKSPISALLLPVAAGKMYYEKRKRKELDWLLFGRP